MRIKSQLQRILRDVVHLHPFLSGMKHRVHRSRIESNEHRERIVRAHADMFRVNRSSPRGIGATYVWEKGTGERPGGGPNNVKSCEIKDSIKCDCWWELFADLEWNEPETWKKTPSTENLLYKTKFAGRARDSKQIPARLLPAGRNRPDVIRRREQMPFSIIAYFSIDECEYNI